jgi:hypothetical protein
VPQPHLEFAGFLMQPPVGIDRSLLPSAAPEKRKKKQLCD